MGANLERPGRRTRPAGSSLDREAIQLQHLERLALARRKPRQQAAEGLHLDGGRRPGNQKDYRNLLRLLEPNSTLDRLMKAVGNGRMSPLRFAQITRQLRKTSPDYLKRVLDRAEERGGTKLPYIVAQRGLAATGDAHFARRMMTIEADRIGAP